MRDYSDRPIKPKRKGWFATASSWNDDRKEAFCEDKEALKGFIDKHADDTEVTLIQFERSMADT